MQKRTAEFIKRHSLLRGGDAVLVGVSGGADSVALLHLLAALAPAMKLTVYAAHFNHGIRGAEADGDEAFVRTLCENMGIPLYCGRGDVPALAKAKGQTLEQAAREARYGFLEEARQHFNADAIAVAHHMDDQAETVLMHLTRGTGLGGLAGMQPKRGRIIRPLLCLRRSEIEEYLRMNGLAYRTDSTNLLREGTRNRIRLDVLPYLSEHINPQTVPALCAAAELMGQDEAYLCACARKALEDARHSPNAYGRKALLGLPPALRGRALRMALGDAEAKQDIERIHIAQVEALLGAQTGAWLHLPGIDAWVEYDLIRVGNMAAEGNASATFAVPLAMEGVTQTPFGPMIAEEIAPGEFKADPFAAHFDVDKLPTGALTVRTRLPGDRFFPLNGPGQRKLKEFFIDKKVPRPLREVPLIACGQDILFVPGFCVADTVKVTASTRRILRVTYVPGDRGEE